MERPRLLRLVALPAFLLPLAVLIPLRPTAAAIVPAGDVQPDPDTTPWTSATDGYIVSVAEGCFFVPERS